MREVIYKEELSCRRQKASHLCKIICVCSTVWYSSFRNL